MSPTTWEQLIAETDAPSSTRAAQCLICGRFVKSATFHDLGMDIHGEYEYRWHCSLCGWRVGS